MTNGVGPVVEANAVGAAIVDAIRADNPGVEVAVIDRGAYTRVLVPERCRVTRRAIERALGRAFTLPGDLELVMSSWTGRIAIGDDEIRLEYRMRLEAAFEPNRAFARSGQ